MYHPHIYTHLKWFQGPLLISFSLITSCIFPTVHGEQYPSLWNITQVDPAIKTGIQCTRNRKKQLSKTEIYLLKVPLKSPMDTQVPVNEEKMEHYLKVCLMNLRFLRTHQVNKGKEEVSEVLHSSKNII